MGLVVDSAISCDDFPGDCGLIVFDDVKLLVERHGGADMPGDSVKDGPDFELGCLWGAYHKVFFAV